MLAKLDQLVAWYGSGWEVRDGVLYDGDRVVARDVDPAYTELLAALPTFLQELQDLRSVRGKYQELKDEVSHYNDQSATVERLRSELTVLQAQLGYGR